MHVALIKNVNGGRIHALLPMKTRPFTNFSSGLNFDLIEFFTLKEAFTQFRKVNKRFNACFEQYLLNITFRHDEKIQ